MNTDRQSLTFHDFGSLLALFFPLIPLDSKAKNKLKIQRKEIVHMEFPHLYVFHVLKEVFLGIIVQQNS